MKPIIGLIPLYDPQRDSWWMLPGYMKLLEHCGALPLMLPLTRDRAELEALLQLCDGLLLTGGQDVSPALYGQAPLPQCGEVCPARDEMESIVLELALQADKPLLGICRGIQFINAALGGTLYQDLPTQHAGSICHSMTPPYNRTIHSVTILPDTPLHAILGCSQLGVNSYHHQAVQKLAPAAKPMAVSEDGLIEGLYIPGKKFMLAVQWHPELCWETDDACRKIAEAFVSACI